MRCVWVGGGGRAVSQQPRPRRPPPPPGYSSPVHAVADPGITDSWAMPGVPPSAPLLGFTNSHLRAPPGAPALKLSPGSGGTGGALWSWDSSGFLQLQIGPHPLGHVTGEGAAPAGRPESAFWGPSSSQYSRIRAGEAGPGGCLPVSLGLRSGEGPRATAQEYESCTRSSENPAEKHVFLSQQSVQRVVHRSLQHAPEQLEPGFLCESFHLFKPSNGAFKRPGPWPRRCGLVQTAFPRLETTTSTLYHPISREQAWSRKICSLERTDKSNSNIYWAFTMCQAPE